MECLSTGTAGRIGKMRPALIYPGGKFRLAPWIVSFFPPHKVYVEPFGGAAGVMVRKKPAALDVYNDLDGEMVNFFRVLRDPDQAAELQRLLRLTPYAKDEFEAAYETADGVSNVERARRLVVRSHMGVGACGATKKTGFRRSYKESAKTANVFVSYVEYVGALSDRFRNVQIENMDVFELFSRYDSPDVLWYVDPPYNAKCGGVYRHAFSGEHEKLLDTLKAVNGFCVLSGYMTDLYRDALTGWHVEQKENKLVNVEHYATEYLWISPRTWDALQASNRALLMQ